jgi:hypothetical protein
MIIFKSKSELRLNLTKINDVATWPEVVGEFVNFLQGCGYIVTGYEIGQYLTEEYNFQKEKTEEKVEPIVLEYNYKPKKKRKRK